ncbi:major facilitator superfamily domain-containing protein 4A-like [Haliotis rubra]|uniref:major facilitator superfamily domain-containing protein 4A-like n=1 Tax=Haliotis rubra TaxID=36100 RepID=UPI001EE5D571|nr:major facilitator superfamily domain-containing protein 4A-like [Haliotis rubra]
MVFNKDVVKASVWSYCLFLLGAFAGTLGPTLLDLESLFQVGLLEISNLFLILATTEGVGCLGSMAVLKFLDSNLVLTICMILQGTSTVMIAMTSHLYVAFVATGVIGLVSSCCFNCVYYRCNLEFAGHPVIMHGLTVSTSVGSVIAPVTAQSFLELQDRTLLSWKNESFKKHTFLPQLSADIPPTNSSTGSTCSGTLCGRYSNDASKYNSTNSTMDGEQSQVHIVYIILGLIHLPAVFGAVTLFVLERRDSCKFNVLTKDDYANMEKQEPMHRLTTTVFYICLLSAYMSTGGIPFAYGSYLSVYGVGSHLHLSAQRMAMMTSVFWMLFTLGRILGTILSLYLGQTVLIYVCLTGVMVAAVSVMFLTPFGEVWLWIGSMAIGLFSAPLLAALLSWCNTFITLTPVVLGICSLGDLIGVFILQYFTGQVMGRFGLHWFFYFLCFFLSLSLRWLLFSQSLVIT